MSETWMVLMLFRRVFSISTKEELRTNPSVTVSSGPSNMSSMKRKYIFKDLCNEWLEDYAKAMNAKAHT